MKCAVHSEVDATGYCRNCGKAMCPACVRPVRDVLYCEDCLATLVGIPAQQAAPAAAEGAGYSSTVGVTPSVRSTSSPAAAFWLGLVPGLGAVYNGEYNKALIHVIVFATLIIGSSSDIDAGPMVLLILASIGFCVFMAIDAMRVAKARNLGEATVDPIATWSKDLPLGPVILIGVGALLLLNNFDFFAFFHVRRLWPLVLIAVGVLMFRSRIGGRS
jgi:cell wall-active antibiotic response 4TMS protein YvqF